MTKPRAPRIGFKKLNELERLAAMAGARLLTEANRRRGCTECPHCSNGGDCHEHDAWEENAACICPELPEWLQEAMNEIDTVHAWLDHYKQKAYLHERGPATSSKEGARERTEAALGVAWEDDPENPDIGLEPD